MHACQSASTVLRVAVCSDSIVIKVRDEVGCVGCSVTLFGEKWRVKTDHLASG